MKLLKLTKNKSAMVNDIDFVRFAKFNWYAMKAGGTWYAARRKSVVEGGKIVLLHREILRAKKNKYIDHKDRNGLNNVRKNLRVCSQSQNMANSRKKNTNTSGYKGITWDGINKKWIAQITHFGKNKKIGRFLKKKEAALAYDRIAFSLNGEFAHLNFPR